MLWDSQSISKKMRTWGRKSPKWEENTKMRKLQKTNLYKWFEQKSLIFFLILIFEIYYTRSNTCLSLFKKRARKKLFVGCPGGYAKKLNIEEMINIIYVVGFPLWPKNVSDKTFRFSTCKAGATPVQAPERKGLWCEILGLTVPQNITGK